MGEPLHVYVYTHRRELLSVLGTEAPFCSRQWLMQAVGSGLSSENKW